MATRAAIRRQWNTTGNRWPQKTHWDESSGLVTPQWGQRTSYTMTCTKYSTAKAREIKARIQ
jgi:hypothetical protein